MAAFIGGVIVRRPLPAALAGGGVLVMATAAYYLVEPIIGSPINPPQYDTPLFWLLLAVPAGAVSGALGSCRDRPERGWQSRRSP